MVLRYVHSSSNPSDVHRSFCPRRKSVLNLNELGQMNGAAGGAAGEDEEFPAPHELGEELKFTGRYEGGSVVTQGPGPRPSSVTRDLSHRL